MEPQHTARTVMPVSARKNVRFLVARALCASLFAAALASGCGDRRSDFVGARVQDLCDESWPVCDTVAGCVLGAESYRAGRFPGTSRFVVRLAEPSIVRVSLFLEDARAAGEQTFITWYEDGCRARIREDLSGKTLFAEAERFGAVTREAELDGVGDHLVEIDSDAQAAYLVKVEVVSRRNTGTE